jgi:hypothetical protein
MNAAVFTYGQGHTGVTGQLAMQFDVCAADGRTCFTGSVVINFNDNQAQILGALRSKVIQLLGEAGITFSGSDKLLHTNTGTFL